MISQTFAFKVRCILFFALAVMSFTFLPNLSAQEKKLNWYKGNTHTHTVNSDGDSTPDEVVRWYREHGYNFLTLSDHNFLTDIAGLQSVFGAAEKFLLIPGEEITDKFEKKDIHINGLNPRELVKPAGGASVVETIQNDVNAIRKVEGVPHVNHPNFNWSITANDLKAIKNMRLFEIYNGHQAVNNLGGGGYPDLRPCGMTFFPAGWFCMASRLTTRITSKHLKTERKPGRVLVG